MRILNRLSIVLILFLFSSCAFTNFKTTRYEHHDKKINNLLVIFETPNRISNYTSESSVIIKTLLSDRGISSDYLLLPDHKSELSLMSPIEIEREKRELIYKKKLSHKINYLLLIKPKTDIMYSTIVDDINTYKFEIQLFVEDSEIPFWEADLNISPQVRIGKNTAEISMKEIVKQLEKLYLI